MKLYAVLILLGHIGGTVGPLPYGMPECLERVAALNADMAARIEAAGGAIETSDGPVMAADVDWQCWHVEERPELGVPVIQAEEGGRQ